jgi:hypothetical protein
MNSRDPSEISLPEIEKLTHITDWIFALDRCGTQEGW